MAIKYTKSGRIDERTAEGKAEMDIAKAQERRVSLAEDLVQQRKELNKEMEKSNSFMNWYTGRAEKTKIIKFIIKALCIIMFPKQPSFYILTDYRLNILMLKYIYSS